MTLKCATRTPSKRVMDMTCQPRVRVPTLGQV
jgi:hypothetical protein